MNPSFDPARFLEAQAPVYERVVRELSDGAKTSHWMWFVFPQLAALGRSQTARFYGLADARDAAAYAAHPVLGHRLRECAALVLAVEGRSAHRIMGAPDDLKLRSCMTLFEAAVPGEALFARLLDRFYDGARDPLTLALLHAPADPSLRPPDRAS